MWHWTWPFANLVVTAEVAQISAPWVKHSYPRGRVARVHYRRALVNSGLRFEAPMDRSTTVLLHNPRPRAPTYRAKESRLAGLNRAQSRPDRR
jgi:hypothetical protein